MPTPAFLGEAVDTSTMDLREERETSRANDMLVWLTVTEEMSAEHTTGSQ